MLSQRLQNLLFERDTPFITVATSQKGGEPNAAPKLILKYSRGCLYLVDVPHGQTWKNLNENPQMAISFVDMERLKAYRIRGRVQILDDPASRAKYHKEVDAMINKMIVSRILQGSNRGKAFGNFLAKVPDDFIIMKVTITEIVEYGLEDIRTRKSTKRQIYRKKGE